MRSLIDQRLNEIDEIIRAGREHGVILTVSRLKELMREEEELKARAAKLPPDGTTPIAPAPKLFKAFVPRGRWLN